MAHSTSGRFARSLFIFSLLLTLPGLARARDLQTSGKAGTLLDLSYLSQTEQLCGGAALSMVLRYWGDRDVVPQDFASLVDRSRGGIHTSTLARAAAERGWPTTVLTRSSSAPDALAADLLQGHPLIALIEDRPSVYHYVVVVGMTPESVVVHDPARAPYRVLSREDFDRRSAAAGGWLMRILPKPGTDGNAAAPAVALTQAALDRAHDARATPPLSACSALVETSVGAARSGNQSEAERGLVAAVMQCPSDAAGWRELAGLRFIQSRYAESLDLSRRAVALAPDDHEAWRLMGTTLYLRDDLAGALDAWNHIGSPRIDVVNVIGLDRTHYPVAVGATGLQPRGLLTPEAFRLAARRLAELPSVATTGLRYKPTVDDKVIVEATVVERGLIPRGALGWATLAIASGFRREARLDVASPTHGGETWTGAYRWAHNRPRARFALSIPVQGALPGLLDIDAMWERQAYVSLASGATPLRETRRRAGARLSSWARSWLRWQAGGDVDRIDSRSYVAVNGRVATRWFTDRIAGVAAVGRWVTTDGKGFGIAEAQAALRSSNRTNSPSWSGRIGVSSATAEAPLALWPAAGSSDGRGVLLRGHALFDDGVITSAVLGRRLVFGNLEYAHPVYFSQFASMSVAGFLDTARASRRRDGLQDTPLHTDVGAGLRVATPTLGGQVRIDVAIGVRDRAKKFSAGYVLPWGR